MKTPWAIAALLVLSGCAHYEPSVPPDYTGPKANIEDTRKYYSSRHADLFFLTHVDGREIENSRINVNLPRLVPPITRGFGVMKHAVLDGCEIAERLVR